MADLAPESSRTPPPSALEQLPQKAARSLEPGQSLEAHPDLSEMGSLQVQVSWLSGQEASSFQLPRSQAAVAAAKLRVFQDTHIPVSEQRLVFNTEVLADDIDLASLVDPGAAIVCLNLVKLTRRLALVSAGSKPELWDISDNPRRLLRLERHLRPVMAMAADWAAMRAVTANTDRDLSLWDLADGTCLRTLDARGDDGWPIGELDMNWEARRAILWSRRGFLTWDLDTWETTTSFKEGIGTVTKFVVDWSGGCRVLVAASDRALGEESLVGLWDPNSRSGDLKSTDHHVSSVAANWKWGMALLGDVDGNLQLWSVDGLKHLMSWKHHAGKVVGVSMDPQAHRAISAGLDGVMCLWDLDAVEPLGSCRVEWMWSLSVDWRGELALAGAGIARLRLWSFASGEISDEAQDVDMGVCNGYRVILQSL